MNNQLGSSYERNRYFKGKLLTTRDFELEQKYFNDKRRLINRLFFGGGIVSGLQVIKIDDKTIAIEKGMAIDSSGREVMLEKDMTRELDKVEGFPEGEFMRDLYLCIQYKEELKDLMNSVLEKREEYNLAKDTSEIFLTEESPETSAFGLMDLIEDRRLLCDVEDVRGCKTVKESQTVRVWQTVPRYVNPGDTFEMVVTLEKGYYAEAVKVEYEWESDEFEPVDETGFQITVTDGLKSKKWMHQAKYRIRARVDATETSGNIRVKDQSIKVTVGDRQHVIQVPIVNSPKIILTSVRERVLEDYTNRSFDNLLASHAGERIYLARISFYKYQTSYIIEKVDKMPVDEYAVSLPLLRALDELDKKRQKQSDTNPLEGKVLEETMTFKEQAAAALNRYCETNTEYIELKKDGENGNRYFSREIPHHLGLGPVYISAGLELGYQDA